MGENSDLEEGEMNCSSIDLDVDLSYIEKKVQNVLGHLQKDFGEGAMGVFGTRICDYGSFLPGYKQTVAVPSFQRIPFGNHAVQKFPNNLPAKNVVQKFQSLPTTTSSKLVSQLKPQNYQTSGSVLAQAPEKVPVKKENSNITAKGLSENKPLRVRIKMGSEILSRKVTMVCNDLGLNDSPTPPTRKSQDNGSRKLLHTSLETSESPSRIIREMTEIPVPEDQLMSPLSDSLLYLKEKVKQCTLLNDEPVLKERKEPFIKRQNKIPDVSSCGETPNGRRRKAVDCFDDTTWNETSSVREMKKRKVFSTGQLAKEKSTFGLGGTSPTNDGFTTKTNLWKDIKKDGDRDPRVESNKVKLVGKQAEKDKMTNPTKLKLNSSKNCFGDKVSSKMPLKDATVVGQNNLDTGLESAGAPSISPDLDNWALCDSCEKWRLLPSGMKPEQLPDKWLCSMQTWLPGMNHCGVSEEETTNAITSSHVTQAHGSLTSGSLPNPVEKKSSVKELSQAVPRDIMVDPAKPMRTNSHVVKIKNIKLPLETRNATQISTGTGSQITIKKKKEGEGDKQFKTGDANQLSRNIKVEEIHRKQDLEWTPELRKTKRQDNDVYTSDVERDTKKRLLAPKSKPDHKPQLTTSSGSLCTDGRINSPVTVRKIRVTGYKKGVNVNNSKLFSDGEAKEPSIDKAVTTKNADTPCKYISGESGQVSGVETTSSSKVLGSHKSGRYVEEVKASPVESVSSSPARSSCQKSLASAGARISWKTQNLKLGDAGSRNVNNIKQSKTEVCEQNSNFGDLSMKKVLENRAETMDKSCQAANDILLEAEKLRKLADCLKSSGFDYEHKETNFKAALKFLRGASLLEMRSTENVEGGKMSHVEAYQIAAKLSENCGHQYETSQEMAAAALAYKCTEVACMRVVYGKSLSLSGELNELQKAVQMTPQGESPSPSSSASDVDSFYHQGVINMAAKPKRGLSHIGGNLLPVARSQQNFASLLDFTENMNLAMEASTKSQNAFRTASDISEETQHAIKKVVDFSFHDVEALTQMIELAMDFLSSSKFRGSK